MAFLKAYHSAMDSNKLLIAVYTASVFLFGFMIGFMIGYSIPRDTVPQDQVPTVIQPKVDKLDSFPETWSCPLCKQEAKLTTVEWLFLIYEDDNHRLTINRDDHRIGSVRSLNKE